jgi:uncharacterized membrane protein
MSAANSHGSTPLAWTVVVIITIAFAIGTLAIVLGNWPMFWVGVGIVALGGIIALIGKRAGAAKH